MLALLGSAQIWTPNNLLFHLPTCALFCKWVSTGLYQIAFCIQLMGGATEAKKGVFSIANDVSSWWANLDPGVPKPSQPSTTSSRTAAEVQQVGTVPGRSYSRPAWFGG